MKISESCILSIQFYAGSKFCVINTIAPLKKTIKELSQFGNKKPEDLESEFDYFDMDDSYPSSPFKGRNIVDLGSVYKQLLDGHKGCKTTLSLTYIKEKN